MPTQVSTSDSSVLGEEVPECDNHDTGKPADVSIVSNTSPETNPTSLLSSPSDCDEPSTSNRNNVTHLDGNNFEGNPSTAFNMYQDPTSGLPLEGATHFSDFRSDVPWSPQMSLGGDEYYILSPNGVKLEDCDSFTPMGAMGNHSGGISSPSLDIPCPILPSCFDDISGFLPPPNIAGIDDAFNSALLGCTFFPSPTAMQFQHDSSGSHQLVINLGDIQPHYTPSVGVMPSASLFSASTEQPTSNCIDENNHDDLNATSNKRNIGKTLDKISQLSCKKSKKRRICRSLPLRRRRDKGQDIDEPKVDNEESPSPPPKNRMVIHRETKEIEASIGTRTIEHFIPSFETAQLLPAEGHHITNATIQGCKCSKSRCLKLYCDCFQAGQICARSCLCKNCHNSEENSGPDGTRTLAIESILIRRPDAFDIRVKKAGAGCSCKKNKCLKKYCDCYNSGVTCTDRCRCLDCRNGIANGNHEENDDQAIKQEENSYSDQIDVGYGEEEPMMTSLEPPFKCPLLDGTNYSLLGGEGNESDNSIPDLAEEEEVYDLPTTTDSYLHYSSPPKSMQYETFTTNMEAV